MKKYYGVLVASQTYHGKEALTYSSDGPVAVGAIVRVPLQKYPVLGIVVTEAERPRFKTKDILEVLDLPPLPSALPKLITWLQEYYPAPLGATTSLLMPGVLTARTIKEDAEAADVAASKPQKLPPLTEDQAAVLAAIDKPDTYLLHGDTGTGKTRVYIELIRQALDGGRSAILLTPEIGLTSQLAGTVRAVFGQQVVVIHSRMTPKARRENWLRILRSAEPLVVVGPRSALFSPLKSVGLIVVDESHEPAYKQEQAPHYHAVRVASQLAALHKSTLVLGSATPSVGDYFVATEKGKKILRMTQLAKGMAESAQEPVIQVIDLKDRSAFTRSQFLSAAMLDAIGSSLARGEQSLLYLNRRGTARVILCSNCGWQAVCPHCDLPLTYHHDLHVLQCHTCGYKQAPPTSCPECGNMEVIFKVVGTKAIEEEVRRLFSGARVMRFDTDNKLSDRFEKHYDAVHAGDVDILVGTQLLAKGLDLPRLSTLGVVIADTSLTFPDFSAEERTYQLITQVLGRVGRGHADAMGEPIGQRIVVQSYDPQRPVIQAALTRNWDRFYQNELAERKLFRFPPFMYLLKLTCRRASSAAAEKAAESFVETLGGLGLPLLIEGPMPSFHARIENKYEWQVVVRSAQRGALLEVIRALPKSGWQYDIDPVNLL